VILQTVERSEISSLHRLDAWYFVAPGAAAIRRLDKAKALGLETISIGGGNGLGRAWMPNRLKQIHAGPGEPSRKYLKPYDVFQYLPMAHADLSISATKGMDAYALKPGWILQTRSGRNLGLNAIVDEYMADFVISDDLIRIDIPDERLRYYATAFLRSKTGHGILRRDKSGSVIDHLSPQQVEAVEVPLLSSDIVDAVAELMKKSQEALENARAYLHEALQDYSEKLPAIDRSKASANGWTVNFSDFTGRLDAAFYHPAVRALAESMVECGGVPVGSVAEAIKPPGRYKTIYVDEEHGLPFMSGTQILQQQFAKPQYMSPSAFKDVEDYKLEPGWSLYQADGRSEKNLGVTSMVTSARKGWIASGHVGRLKPKNPEDAGWLWLASRTEHFAMQLKAQASGSVVDATYPEDAERVILPPKLDIDGAAIVAAWEGFATSERLEKEAVAAFDAALGEITGIDDSELEDD
jgi:hypothetical protein